MPLERYSGHWVNKYYSSDFGRKIKCTQWHCACEGIWRPASPLMQKLLPFSMKMHHFFLRTIRSWGVPWQMPKRHMLRWSGVVWHVWRSFHPAHPAWWGDKVVLELVTFISHRRWPVPDRNYSAFDLFLTFCCQPKYFAFPVVQEMYIFILWLHVITGS